MRLKFCEKHRRFHAPRTRCPECATAPTPAPAPVPTVDEAAIRADERAKVEAEVLERVEMLAATLAASGDGDRAVVVMNVAKYLRACKHRSTP